LPAILQRGLNRLKGRGFGVDIGFRFGCFRVKIYIGCGSIFMCMSEDNRRRITVGWVVSWLFGLLTLGSAISLLALFDLIAAILLGVVTAICLPPIRRRVCGTVGIEFSRPMIIVMVVGLMMIAGTTL
jgi:hypothetical protein